MMWAVPGCRSWPAGEGLACPSALITASLPTISRKLSASTQDLQWVVDAYALVFASLLLVGCNLGDRLGRRRILQAGLVLFALTSAGVGLSRTTGELIGARAAMGAAAALIFPATLALLITTFTNPRERATAIGVWSAIAGLAVAIGPVSGGLLLRHFSWRSVFSSASRSRSSPWRQAPGCCPSRGTPALAASTRPVRCCR